MQTVVDNAFLSNIMERYLYNYIYIYIYIFVQYIMVLEICIFLIDRDEQYIKW